MNTGKKHRSFSVSRGNKTGYLSMRCSGKKKQKKRIVGTGLAVLKATQSFMLMFCNEPDYGSSSA